MKITKSQIRTLIHEASGEQYDRLQGMATKGDLAAALGKQSYTGTKNINITGNMRITRVVKSADQLRRERTSYHRWEELNGSERDSVIAKASTVGVATLLGWVVNVLLVNGATLPGLPDIAPQPFKDVPYQKGMVYYVPMSPGGIHASLVYYQLDGFTPEQQKAIYNTVMIQPEALKTSSYEGQNDTEPKARRGSKPGSETETLEPTGVTTAPPTAADIPGAVKRLKTLDKLSPGAIAKMLPSIKFAADKGTIPGSIRSQFQEFTQADFVSLLSKLGS